MIRSLLMQGTVGIFSIITTSEVNHLVKDTPEAIVAFMIVFIVWRMSCRSQHIPYSGLLALLSETKVGL